MCAILTRADGKTFLNRQGKTWGQALRIPPKRRWNPCKAPAWKAGGEQGQVSHRLDLLFQVVKKNVPWVLMPINQGQAV
jgi:hypothetical protein